MRWLALARGFFGTLRRARRLRTREDLERYQTGRLQALYRAAPRFACFYRNLKSEAFPVIDKALLLSRFRDFNRLRLDAAKAFAMIEEGRAPRGYDLGCSTGTSGNRGLYLVSDKERFLWLGTILAKTLPDVLLRRPRVAVILPRMSRLYAGANQSRLVRLRFFDLREGLERLAPEIAALRPMVLVAPPKVLRYLAERRIALGARRLFSAAEVLDPPDRAIIEAAFGLKLGEIYMATEGLFAVTCPHGMLHLAEDAVHFELEPVEGHPGLVSPVVTDLTRRAQVMIRYRMNDLLEMAPQPCRCGSPLRAVAAVLGRADDVFVLPRCQGEGAVEVTPDILRNAVLADGGIEDFRLVQITADTVELHLPPVLGPACAILAAERLRVAFEAAGAAAALQTRMSELPPPTGGKLRRVERRWQGDPP